MGQRVIETQGLTELTSLLLDALGVIQPTGEARTLLADALKKARDLTAWLHCLQDKEVSVSPSWTEFTHSNGYCGQEKDWGDIDV
jgi:hypothetical protein